MLTIANAGVPMLAFVAPVMLLALGPIVLVEAWWLWRRLGLGFRRAATGSLAANAVSTIVGVPLTWIALVIVQLVTGGGSDRGEGMLAVTWQAAWLPPIDRDEYWMIAAAGLFLNLPFFLVSGLIEVAVLRRMWRDVEPARLRRHVWLGNVITYAGLLVFWGMWLVRTS